MYLQVKRFLFLCPSGDSVETELGKCDVLSLPFYH